MNPTTDPHDDWLYYGMELVKYYLADAFARITTPEKVDLAVGYLDGNLSFDNVFQRHRAGLLQGRLTDERMILAGAVVRLPIMNVIYCSEQCLKPFENANTVYVWRVREHLARAFALLGDFRRAQLAALDVQSFDVCKLRFSDECVVTTQAEIDFLGEIEDAVKTAFREIIAEYKNRKAQTALK